MIKTGEVYKFKDNNTLLYQVVELALDGTVVKIKQINPASQLSKDGFYLPIEYLVNPISQGLLEKIRHD